MRDGDLGAIRFVSVEHASGWAATPLELSGHKQASWRTDPDIAGHTSVVADLGTHAFHLLAEILRGQTARDLSIPTGLDGLIGVRFVEAAVASHAEDAAWVTME